MPRSSSKKSTTRSRMPRQRRELPPPDDPTVDFAEGSWAALIYRPDGLRALDVDGLASVVEILTGKQRRGASAAIYLRRALDTQWPAELTAALERSHALSALMSLMRLLASSVALKNLAGELPFDHVELRDTLVHLSLPDEDRVRAITDREALGRLLRQQLWDYFLEPRDLPVTELQDLLILRTAQLRRYRRVVAQEMPLEDPDYCRFSFVRPGRIVAGPRSEKEFWADITAWDVLVFDEYQATGDGRKWGWLLGRTVNPFSVFRAIDAAQDGGRKLNGCHLWQYMR